jgi:hypothetical protein
MRTGIEHAATAGIYSNVTFTSDHDELFTGGMVCQLIVARRNCKTFASNEAVTSACAHR